MQLDVSFNQIFNESIDNVYILSIYRTERCKEFPGVPLRQFTDWTAHREWMRRERTKFLRMVNNHRIQLECEEAEAAENQPKDN